MANTELKEKVKQALLNKLDIDEEQKAELEYDTLLFGANGIGLDSVDALELVTLIYDEWEIDVPTDDMKKLSSISNIADYIESRVK